MINSVRNTVLAILNKNNYGYISPSDFNLFAKQAQLDIFDEYFISYNNQINKENARVSGTGYADINKGYEEVIDTFSVTASLSLSSKNCFGTSEFILTPFPPATIIATFFTYGKISIASPNVWNLYFFFIASL